MTSDIDTLALYTTIYPSAAPFLPAWAESVRRQTDQDFWLWVGLDGVGADAVQDMLGTDLRVTWIEAESGDTPAQVRQRALTRVVEDCDGVVLVDSDDILHPTRVAAARHALASADVTGCALRLVGEEGEDLDTVLGLPSGARPEDVLPRHNIYGFSNSAYRSGTLRRCLPIPAKTVLVDWLLVTRAWLGGAALTFDSVVRMDYRQHGANTAHALPPFTARRVWMDTALVRRHFELLGSTRVPEAVPGRLALVHEVAADVDAFYERVCQDPDRLEEYARALDVPASPLVWWSCVAHPSLQYLWKDSKEPA